MEPFKCGEVNSITYTSNIGAIIQRHCYACHDGSTFDVNLTTYGNVKKIANNGQLLKSIEYQTVQKMPPDYPLKPCEIEQIRDWISQGALLE